MWFAKRASPPRRRPVATARDSFDAFDAYACRPSAGAVRKRITLRRTVASRSARPRGTGGSLSADAHCHGPSRDLLAKGILGAGTRGPHSRPPSFTRGDPVGSMALMRLAFSAACVCLFAIGASCGTPDESDPGSRATEAPPASPAPSSSSSPPEARDAGSTDAPAKTPPKLLFKSAFGPGVTLGAPEGVKDLGGWQPLKGLDQETGFAWPVAALGATFSGVQLVTAEPVDAGTVEQHIACEIRNVDGPHGLPVRELFQNVLKKGPVGSVTTHAQAPLLINRPWTIGDVTDLYVSYWFRHQSNLIDLLDSSVSSGNWRVQFEFKTGGYEGDWRGDYRIATNILKEDGKLIWLTKGDNVANGPWAGETFWAIRNKTVPVPVGAWFQYEVFWHRSAGADGRFWSAVNGEVIVDHSGPNMGHLNLPINRIMLNNAYSGGLPPVESHTTRIEMWTGFPCGEGIPCYRK